MTDTIEEIRARHEALAEKLRVAAKKWSETAKNELPYWLTLAEAVLPADVVEQKDGWQPIETAPKDGTQILACKQLPEHLTAQGHVPDLSIVKWDDREQEFVAMADGYMSIKSQGDNWTTYHEPYVTHWMPLPTPPATNKDTQDE